MNREQMIAWLTLEGWQAHKGLAQGGTRYVEPGLFRDNVGWYVPDPSAHAYRYYSDGFADCVMPMESMSDEHLAKIYEAISRQVP